MARGGRLRGERGRSGAAAATTPGASVKAATPSQSWIPRLQPRGMTKFLLGLCGGWSEELERVVGVADQAALRVLLNERFQGYDRHVLLAGLGLLDGGAEHLHFLRRHGRGAGFPFPVQLLGNRLLLQQMHSKVATFSSPALS